MHFLLLIFLPSLLFAAPPQRVRLATGENRTLLIAGLIRAAVGDAKIVRVKAVPPSTLVVTALKVGVTEIRVWDDRGERAPIVVECVARSLAGSRGTTPRGELVRVSLEFFEMDKILSQSLGVQWPDALRFGASAIAQGGQNFTGINYTVTFGSVQGWVRHLMKEGFAKLLARPQLSVRLGEEATFHSGGEVPIPTSSETYGRSRSYVDWKKYGLTVKISPHSLDYARFHSDVSVEISELQRATSLENVPGLTRRKLDTKMESQDGETVILSGLLRKVVSSHKEGLPLLSKIPLLGLLFSTESSETEESELLLLMTLSFADRARDRETLDRFHDRFTGKEE